MTDFAKLHVSTSQRLHAAFVVAMFSFLPAALAQLPLLAPLESFVAQLPEGDAPFFRPGALALADAVTHHPALFVGWGAGFVAGMVLMATAGALVTAHATGVLVRKRDDRAPVRVFDVPWRFVLSGLLATMAEGVSVLASLFLGAGIYASLYETWGPPRAVAVACVPLLVGLGTAASMGVLYELLVARMVIANRGALYAFGSALSAIAAAPFGLVSSWGARALARVAMVVLGELATRGVVWDSPVHGARILAVHAAVLVSLALVRVSWLERAVVAVWPVESEG